MVILHIETSTNVCSIALSDNEQCIFKKEDFQGMNHAALLSLFIEEALTFSKNNNLKLDAVAVSGGPGSYTGLRIGVSTAKGLCYGLGIPLITVDTLKIMAFAATKNVNDSKALFCSMIDARRMEVYTEISNAKGEIVREVSADIIDENSYADLLDKNTIYFFGNGSGKCKQVLNFANAQFIENIVPLAENMITFAYKAYQEQKFADVAYFEPFYLKEFQATTPKTKL